MDWSTRSVCNAVRNERVSRGRNVRAADADISPIGKSQSEPLQPVTIGISVIIDVSDYVSSCGPQPRVAGRAQPGILRLNQAYVIPGRDLGSCVCRSVIDHNQFVIRIIQAFESS